MDECVSGRDGVREGSWIKSVSYDDLGARRNSVRARFSHERPNAMTAGQ
jgi:hypothetical protein